MSNSTDIVSGRIWIFEADVRGYYIPEKPLVIDDFQLKTEIDEEKSTRILASLRVQASNFDGAEKLAIEKFERIFGALTLSTGREFDFEVVSAKEITPAEELKEKRYHMEFANITFPFVEELKEEKIEQVRNETQEILQLLEKANSFSKKAMEYFIIGTKLSKWPREAFLPFFKAIELISDKFKPEFEKRIKEKIPDLEPKEIERLATNRRKISNACEILGIKKVNEEIGRIVTTRNRLDIAHASLKSTFKKEYADECRELARELVVNYIKSLRGK